VSPAPVAVTGWSGFIGRHLRPLLADRPVWLLGRSRPDPAPVTGERWLPVDLAGPVSLAGLPDGTVLCHLAWAAAAGPGNLAHNRHLLDAVAASPGVARVVVLSSVSVYGLRASGQLDEASPCRPDSEYARTKLACERLWRERLRDDLPLTVLRPSTVVGPGGLTLRALTRDALDRPAVGILKKSLMGDRSVNFVAVSNVAAAISFVLDRPQRALRECYVVAEDHRPENASYAAMQDAVRRLAGRPPLPSLPVPGWAVRRLAAATGRPLDVRRTFSSRALRSAGYADARPLLDELRQVVAGALAPGAR
jgi:nucleoside-diphosphate-sugar epimerase